MKEQAEAIKSAIKICEMFITDEQLCTEMDMVVLFKMKGDLGIKRFKGKVSDTITTGLTFCCGVYNDGGRVMFVEYESENGIGAMIGREFERRMGLETPL